MTIGEKIKALRKAKKLTQEQLAEFLDISRYRHASEAGGVFPDHRG